MEYLTVNQGSSDMLGSIPSQPIPGCGAASSVLGLEPRGRECESHHPDYAGVRELE